MRRLLVLYGLAMTSVVVVAFLVPLGLLARSLAEERALSAGRQDAQSVAVFAGGILALVAFVLVERRAAEPVLSLEVLGRRVVLTAALTACAVGAATIGLSSYIPSYLERSLGTPRSARRDRPATATGRRFLPLRSTPKPWGWERDSTTIR